MPTHDEAAQAVANAYFPEPSRYKAPEPLPTMRDRFAMAVITGAVAYDGLEGNDIEAMSAMAYELADAMLKARDKAQ